MLRFAMALLLGAVCCCANTITYDVNLTIGAGGVIGDIVTDGTIGALSDANIVGWSLVLNDGTDLPFTLTNSNSTVDITPADVPVTATATQLLFDFTDASGDFVFSTGSGPSLTGVCWSISPDDCLIPGQTGTGISLIVGGAADNAQFTSASVVGNSPGGGSTPEPATVALLGLGMIALAAWKFRGRVLG